jgi:hypothetical protein
MSEKMIVEYLSPCDHYISSGYCGTCGWRESQHEKKETGQALSEAQKYDKPIEQKRLA